MQIIETTGKIPDGLYRGSCDVKDMDEVERIFNSLKNANFVENCEGDIIALLKPKVAFYNPKTKMLFVKIEEEE